MESDVKGTATSKMLGNTKVEHSFPDCRARYTSIRPANYLLLSDIGKKKKRNQKDINF
jgi:hypothetical protein